MQKTMIIIGAGISGLSTGCYAQMNGYKTTTLESHNIPGGLCTAWTRKGYTFDLSMHMLVHVMFGVDMDLAKEPSRFIFETDKPITIGDDDFSSLSVMTHCFDKGTAPAGKTAIEVWYATDYAKKSGALL